MAENRDGHLTVPAWWIGDVLHVGKPQKGTVRPAPPEPMRDTLRARLADIGVDPSELSFPYPGDQHRFDNVRHED